MRRIWVPLMTLMLVFSFALSSEAVLTDRGGGMIYDSDLNITWLQDANYARTSGYDADGLMTWLAATTWAANLSYGGFDDWRLPTFDEDNPWNMGPLPPSPYHEMEYLRRGEGISPSSPGPFINMSHYSPTGEWIEPWYWTGTLDSLDPTKAWRFDFTCG
jgi:hypothetical protein